VTRILFVGQDKGGVGKSTLVRGVAEAIPEVPILEIDSAHRLIEFDRGRGAGRPRQVTHFEMRATRAEIEKSGGKAARREFDAVVRAVEGAEAPTVVDIGANTCGSLFELLAEIAPDLKEAGIALGVLTVVTAEAPAITEALKMSESARAWADVRFVVENRLKGAVPPDKLAKIAGGAPISVFEEIAMEAEAVEFLEARGLRDIPHVDRAQLNSRYGISQGTRIRRDLTNFRVSAMEAVRDAAVWLAGE